MNGSDTQPIWKYLKENAETAVEEIDWVSSNPDSCVLRLVYCRVADSVELLQVPDQGWKYQVVPS